MAVGPGDDEGDGPGGVTAQVHDLDGEGTDRHDVTVVEQPVRRYGQVARVRPPDQARGTGGGQHLGQGPVVVPVTVRRDHRDQVDSRPPGRVGRRREQPEHGGGVVRCVHEQLRAGHGAGQHVGAVVLLAHRGLAEQHRAEGDVDRRAAPFGMKGRQQGRAGVGGLVHHSLLISCTWSRASAARTSARWLNACG